MTGDRDGTDLFADLVRLSPSVFSHPIWVQYVGSQAPAAAANVNELRRASDQLEAAGEWLDAGELLLVCAALQSRRGDQVAASASARRAQTLADRHDLYRLSWWADWAAGALSARRGDYDQAAKHLQHLEADLNQHQEWVLANIVSVLGESLVQGGRFAAGDGAGSLPGPALEPLPERALTWLVRWGDPPSTIQADRGSPLQHEPDDHAASSPAARRPTRNGEQDPTGVVVSSHPAEPTLAVCCLGAFRVYHHGRIVKGWPGRKPMAVFKYLLLSYPTPVPKEVLMDMFWQESGQEAARRSLHQAIYSLRQILKQDNRERTMILFEDDRYAIDPHLELWLDFQEFQDHVHAGRTLEVAGQSAVAMAEYGIAESLYQGDFLEDDLYEDWSTWLREQLRQTYLDIADRLAEYYVQLGEWPAAIALCHRILDRDHCYERAHRRLMRCYAAQGQRHLAIRQYQVCVDALEAELDVAPLPETVELYRQLVAQPIPA